VDAVCEHVTETTSDERDCQQFSHLIIVVDSITHSSPCSTLCPSVCSSVHRHTVQRRCR